MAEQSYKWKHFPNCYNNRYPKEDIGHLKAIADSVGRYLNYCHLGKESEQGEKFNESDIILFRHDLNSSVPFFDSQKNCARFGFLSENKELTKTILITQPSKQAYLDAKKFQGHHILLLHPYHDFAEQIGKFLDLGNSDVKSTTILNSHEVSSSNSITLTAKILNDLMELALVGNFSDIVHEDPFWKGFASLKKIGEQNLEDQCYVRFFGPWSKSCIECNKPNYCLANWNYALELVGADYVSTRHDHSSLSESLFKKDAADPDRLKEFLEVNRAYRFVEVCHDLLKSLGSRHCFSYKPEESEEQNYILIIDDNLQPNQKELLQKIRDVFLGKMKIVWWNPIEKKEGQEVEWFDPEDKIPVSPDESKSNSEKLFDSLKDFSTSKISGIQTFSDMPPFNSILGKARFVFVDILFKGDSKGDCDGLSLIRSLRRFFRDFSDKFSETNSCWQLPKIFAFSKSQEVDLIQDALRAGAVDYLAKSRMLSMPHIISSVHRGTNVQTGHQHRNFRKLYRLPNQTITLLKHLKIPPIPGTHLTDLNDLVYSQEQIENYKTILNRIPKTDLHVHVGSMMSPEFLIVASLFGLSRHKFEKIKDQLFSLKILFMTFLKETQESKIITLKLVDHLSPDRQESCIYVTVRKNCEWIEPFAESVIKLLKKSLESRLDSKKKNKRPEDKEALVKYKSFRALLHKDLGVKDHLLPEEAIIKIKSIPNLKIAFFAIRNCCWQSGVEFNFCDADIIRVYLLVLAARSKDGENNNTSLQFKKFDFLNYFRSTRARGSNNFKSKWNKLGVGANNLSLIPESYKSINLNYHRVAVKRNFLNSPIEWTLASGTRSNNLVEYLEGCEFSGAEHLQHPFLMQLFSQQVVIDFIRDGVMYAELRGSPDGYVNKEIGFEFPDACLSFANAFSEAQKITLNAFHKLKNDPRLQWYGDILGGNYRISKVKNLFRDVPIKHFPVKISLIYTGKRHKPTSQMILEAAAAAVMRPSDKNAVLSARNFVENELDRCRVVGFDLAGAEVGNPPKRFSEEFTRLSRLHIPLTVHAGENESAQFIEDSILELRARRIGHGLSLAEDPSLMARVREERVCIELCPVSNHQTSHFSSPTEKGNGRKYPLRDYLEAGIMVCINTDNPFTSNTNIIKEYFQASYAYGGNGLSLWEALRIIRYGFVNSFLNLPERKAMLELVEQNLIDYFSDSETVKLLNDLADETKQ